MKSKFKKGSRVSHPKYGTGTVITVNDDGERCHIIRDEDGDLWNLSIKGLTLLDAPEQKYDRASIAAMAMGGLLSNGKSSKLLKNNMALIAECAVEAATALIAELQRTEQRTEQ